VKTSALVLALVAATALADTRQEHVHEMSGHVMPFDMAKTTHVFVMTERGGVQKVIAKDARDEAQVALIRQHLRHEYENFSRGNYADPAMLHGQSMLALTALQAGAKKVTVRYSALPDGAELTFETRDLRLLTAIHRWFGAQLSEHGADAKTE
jgi:hypothetical protein